MRDNCLIYDLVHLLVTNRCNLKCEHCLAESGHPSKDELTIKEMIEVVKQLNRMSYKHIHFEGGEPLIREDFDKILGTFTTLENATIISNGTIPYDARFNVLKRKKLNGLMISCDNFGRPERGQYKKIFPNLLRYKEKGLPVKIRTTVTRQNIPFMEEIIKLAIKHKIDTVRFGSYKVLGRGSKDRMKDEYAFDKESYKKLFSTFAEMINKYGDKVLIKLSTPSSLTTTDEGYSILDIINKTNARQYAKRVDCFAFHKQFNIFANGDVSACNECPHQIILGNVRNDLLSKIIIRKEIYHKNYQCCHGHVLISSDNKTYDMQ